MTQTPQADQRRKYLTMFVVAVILTVLYMIYLARIDASLPLVTRRPGGRPIVTWQRDPTGYLLAFVPMVMGFRLLSGSMEPALFLADTTNSER